MGCVNCGRGFHQFCKKCRKDKCHPEITIGVTESDQSDESNRDVPRRRKSAKENLLDPKSTGRKRAARLYPIDAESSCEWRGLKNCGGGLRPIIGCYDGKQYHRHHGPVKDTTRNELGNVHRICVDCHNHWHELNDLIYDESNYGLLPHQPVPATDKEVIDNILAWKTGQMGKNFELASSRNKNATTQPTILPHDSDEGTMGSDSILRESSDREEE